MKMMIMAQQHPQREPPRPSNHSAQQDQLITNNQNQSQRQPTAAPFNEAFHVPKHKMIVTNENQPPINKQQQQQNQDDTKRGLIRNQLYLIEQLQLENADLRNERDQLQLENEELKFQLQMISSSNILSQPGGTFNNHQTLVGNGESGPRALPLDNGNARVVNSLTVRKTTPPTTDGGVVVGTDETANRSTTAKPLFGTSLKKMGVEQQVQLQGNNFLVRSSSRSPAILDKESVSEISSSKAGVSHIQNTTTIRIPQQSTTPTITVNNKSLGFKSTSLTAINVNSVTVSLAKRARRNGDDDDDDESEQRRKFVEHIYGDSERIQAAAIVIQRAFRKRQICKRFRAITEQLRQARQPNGNQLQQSEHKSEPSSPNASTRGRSVAEGFTFASGATRAAAWESLSYAASRLAAAAASAASAKQNENEITPPTQQQQPPSSKSNQRTISQQQKVSRNHQQQHQQPLTDSRVPLKAANPVVAAAINFQQLESIRKRQYRVGLNIFNKSPEKGVSFLIAHSFIDASPPFAKNSSSYYHSNQLHFIDKQHVLHERTVASLQDSTTINLQQCQLCTEEENLKRNIAYFLLHRKGLAKEKIGQYLGNLQENFNQDVLKYYLQELDFNGIQVDLALRKFLSTFRLPGEAQKIERIVDCFAQRYVQCQQLQFAPLSTAATNVSSMTPQQPMKQQPVALQTNQTCQQQTATTIQQQNTPQYKNNLMLLSKDEIFILTFAIIMLNTDLHSPSLKPTSRMSPQQFVNNLRGVFKSHNINESDLIEIYDRVKANQITTTPDHVSHVMKVQQGLTVNNFQKKELPNLCVPHRRLVCFCRLFEVYDVTKKERPGQHQREIFLFNDLLLVTKLARRVRANPTQTYTNRQSIPLQGLYVQLFQSQHYLFGIRLCRKSDDETLIMFNARNELDQSRFVDDLSESIAEMDEMETIKAHNLVETIHFRQQERLRRHRMSHAISENAEDNKVRPNMVERCDATKEFKNSTVAISSQRKTPDNPTPLVPIRKESDEIPIPASSQLGRKLRGKFSSMMNLSSNEDDENKTHPKGLRLNHSFVQQQQQPTNQPQELCPPTAANNQPGSHNDSGTSSGQRRSSTGSVHSLDSGLFLSRDISPNQSS